MMFLAPIKVWRFEDAPEELRILSDAGGDEDWLALVPKWMVDEKIDISWIHGPLFGRYTTRDYDRPDGSRVLIGEH